MHGDGAEAEVFLQVYPNTPGLPQEYVMRALLAPVLPDEQKRKYRWSRLKKVRNPPKPPSSEADGEPADF